MYQKNIYSLTIQGFFFPVFKNFLKKCTVHNFRNFPKTLPSKALDLSTVSFWIRNFEKIKMIVKKIF